jgi:4-hydroxysphinganine ceramide fatty acyl 2-hydroxylase
LYLTLIGNNTIITNIICFLFGIAYWTLGENIGHRFLFHGEDYWMKKIPNNKEIRTFHFLIHGIHHAFPMDRLRLVFPPLPGFILMYIVFGTPIRNLFYLNY